MGDKELLTGAVGQMMIAFCGALLIMGFYLLLFGVPVGGAIWTANVKIYFVLSFIGYTIFLFSLVLLRLSLARITDRHETGQTGIIGAKIGLGGAVIGTIYSALAILEIPGYTSDVAQILAILLSVFLGVSMLLIGASFIVYAGHFTSSGLWNAAGLTYILAGAVGLFAILLGLSVAISPLTILAAAIGAVCFFKSKTPA
jgi:hypothetical protein